MIVLVFDTETSGLPTTSIINDTSISSWPYIVQFTYIMYDTESNSVIKTSNNIINIPTSIVLSPANIAIHGITRAIMDASGRQIVDVITEFLTDLENTDILVAHNLDFDRNMTIAEIYRTYSPTTSNQTVFNLPAIIRFQTMKSYCTMKRTLYLSTFTSINPTTGKEYKKYFKLSELYFKLFNVVPRNMHNALCDVYACLRCFIKLQYNIDVCIVNSTLNTQITTLLHPTS